MATWIQSTKIVRAGGDDRGRRHVPASFTLHPEIRNLSFQPNALFAAIARCNLSKGAPRRVAQSEARATAEWLSSLVDEQTSDFELLPAVRFYKDFVRTGKIGQLAAGMAYLYMIRRGYPFVMHWEDAPVRPAPRHAAQTSPDFIFVGDKNEWVLMESKGKVSGSLADTMRAAHKGYTNQVDPYIGTSTGSVNISHGFVVGVHTTPPSQTSLCVVRTPEPQPASGRGGEGAPRLTQTATIRACYRHVFALMGLDQVVAAIGGSEPPKIAGLRELVFGGRTVLVASAMLNDALRTALSADEELESPFAGLFGIEKQIGSAVLEAIGSSDDTAVAEPIAALSDDVLGRLETHVAAFPDGLIWIPLRELELENEGRVTIPPAPASPPAQAPMALPFGPKFDALSVEHSFATIMISEPQRIIYQLREAGLPQRAIGAALAAEAKENGWDESLLRTALRLRRNIPEKEKATLQETAGARFILRGSS